MNPTYILNVPFLSFLVLNAASKRVKKIGLFAYRPIISLAMIIIGGYILFDDRRIAIIELLYVSAGIFILFLMILAFWFSLTQFRQLKIPKLYSWTSKGSLESKNGSKYTPLVYDV